MRKASAREQTSGEWLIRNVNVGRTAASVHSIRPPFKVLLSSGPDSSTVVEECRLNRVAELFPGLGELVFRLESRPSFHYTHGIP